MPTLEDVVQEFQHYWYAAMHSMTSIDAAVAFLDENNYYHLQPDDLAAMV
jgi:hypothetical protein